MFLLTKNDVMISIAELNMFLLKAYAFGDRFLAPVFRSSVMSALNQNLFVLAKQDGSTSVYVGLVRYAYDNIQASSIVLQRLVDRFYDCWTRAQGLPEDGKAHKDLPIAFVYRAMIRFSEK
jgi:hypothetical protein